MEPQDDYYDDYFGKIRRRKPSSWRLHLLAVVLVLAVGTVVIVSGVTDHWLPADNDREAYTIEPENLDALR